jgi:hypothetical protein
MFAAKAIIGFLMPMLMTGILNALSGIGLSGTMTLQNAITALLTGALVYLVPNSKKSV